MVATLDVIGFADAVALKPAPMGFAALVPAEYFTPPPPVVDPANGRVSLCRGQILVSWKVGCSMFNRNLQAARRIKDKHGAWYQKGEGWLFNKAHVLEVLREFAALVIDPAVAELVRPVLAEAIGLKTEPVIVKAPEAPKTLHGTITVNQWGEIVVAWGGRFRCPSDAFNAYLFQARNIKADCGGSFDKRISGWRFPKSAAGRIVNAFPETHFDYCDELKGQKAEAPAPKAPVTTGSADALASNLLANADDILNAL